MSRGLGHVQGCIVDAFEEHPRRRFTVVELAALAYPGETIQRKHKEAVRRALKKLEAELGLWKCRVGHPGAFGWRHVIGRNDF